jgi:hypothetical protein
MPSEGNGFIYILSNPAMPSAYKVGLTTNTIKQRIQELTTTGVPQPFQLEKKYEVPAADCYSIEQLAHKKLKNNHFGKEFFKAPLNIIEFSVEDAIYEITKTTSIELVGQAVRRKEERDRQIRIEREERDIKMAKELAKKKHIQERVDYENKIIDELRKKYISDLNNKNDSNSSILDYGFMALGAIFFGALAVGILMIGPIGWIAVAAMAWWMKHESEERKLKRVQSSIDESINKYPYKSFKDIEKALSEKKEKEIENTFHLDKKLVNFKSPDIWDPFRKFPVKNSTKSVGANMSDSIPVVHSQSKENAQAQSDQSDLTCLSLSQNLDNPNILSTSGPQQRSYRVFKSLSEYVNYRVDAEINIWYARDSWLWISCGKATKNLNAQASLYKSIRRVYITDNLKMMFVSLTQESLDAAVSTLGNMPREDIEIAIVNAT